jgi:hypothetical protein
VRGAPVEGFLIAVVTALRAGDDAITTNRKTTEPRARTRPPEFDVGTIAKTAVTTHRVSVIAGLVWTEDCVTARPRDAGFSNRWTEPTRFEFAVFSTAVALCIKIQAVVAFFAGIENEVSARHKRELIDEDRSAHRD